jgi:hypothetical protein
MNDDHESVKKKKDEDLKAEKEKLVQERKTDQVKFNKLQEELKDQEKKYIEGFEQKIIDLNNEISEKDLEKIRLTEQLSSEKEKEMKKNDVEIAVKREILEKLRQTYVKAENDFKKEREELERDIADKKSHYRNQETQLTEELNKLKGLQDENEKLNKQINVKEIFYFRT